MSRRGNSRQWRSTPADARGTNRALQAAVQRGDHKTAHRLTKRAAELQQQLFGAAGEPNDMGRPFNDDLPF